MHTAFKRNNYNIVILQRRKIQITNTPKMKQKINVFQIPRNAIVERKLKKECQISLYIIYIYLF